MSTKTTSSHQAMKHVRSKQDATKQSSAFSHVPGGKNRVIQLDFVRGIAILIVMEFHFRTVPGRNWFERAVGNTVKPIGWIGVDLFFVLSGFLVGGLLVQEIKRTGDLRVWRFIKRRMFKIWPAYYAYILFQVVIHRHPISSFLWQNTFNIQNYVGTSLAHTWSLAIEEHFYLVLPPLLLLLLRHQWSSRHILKILGAICLGVLLLRTWMVFDLHSPRADWYTQTRLDSLLFGVILSYLLYYRRAVFDRILRYRLPLALFSVAGFVLPLLLGKQSKWMSSFGLTWNYFCLGAFILLVYGYRGRLIETRLYRVIAAIGVYSYGIYLWHLSVRDPIAAVVSRFPMQYQWWPLQIGQYASAIALGMLMTRLIEWPMLRLREKIVPKVNAQSVPFNP